MKNCPSCGQQCQGSEIQCPSCGTYYSKIARVIAELEADEERRSLRGRCKRILNSGNIKNELLAELTLFKQGLSKKSWFTIYLIIAFVFALVLSVL
jgi:uncharacterized membrane protein YvbJ